MAPSPIFKVHYQDYLRQLKGLDFKRIAPKLGGYLTDGGGMSLRFFSRDYEVSPGGIRDNAGNAVGYDIAIILCRYLIMCPDRLPEKGPWSAFKDFKDSGPLTVYFRDNVEQDLISVFDGQTDALKRGAEALGGTPPDLSVDYDLSVRIAALPRIPMILLFNEADAEFPADCTVLFRQSAENFLDAECLAMLGYQLVRQLKHAASA